MQARQSDLMLNCAMQGSSQLYGNGEQLIPLYALGNLAYRHLWLD